MKLGRAEYHLIQLEKAVERHGARNPHSVTKRLEGNRRKRWKHIINVPQIADPWFPVVAGEFLFNLRSALDHLAVALVPRSRRGSTSFPVVPDDIWERNRCGRYHKRFANERASWNTKTKGMPKDAIAIIKSVQPYHLKSHPVGPSGHVIALVSALENADKHRELLYVTTGLLIESALVVYPDGTEVPFDFVPVPSFDLADDGAEINFPTGLGVKPGAVEVKVEGSIEVELGNAEAKRNRGPFIPVPIAFRIMFNYINEQVIGPLDALL